MNLLQKLRGYFHEPKKFFRLFAFSFLVSIVVYARRPDIFKNPGLWAEDGFWLMQAYNNGFVSSVLETKDGYLQSISRLTAWIASVFPLHMAPEIFLSVAVLGFLLPVALVFTKQFKQFVPSARLRVVFSFLYLLLPNTGGVYLNLTNSMWFFALAAVMILLLERPRSRLVEYLQQSIVVLSGMSGPFTFLLLPIAGAKWFFERGQWNMRNVALVLATSSIQATAMLFSAGDERLIMAKGTWQSFFEIISWQVVWGSLVGKAGVIEMQSWFIAGIIQFVTILLLLFLAFYVYLRGKRELKLFLGFACLVFVSSLATSTASQESSSDAFAILASAFGVRYWLIPMIGFWALLLWTIFQQKSVYIKIIPFVFLLLSSILFWFPGVFEKRLQYSPLPNQMWNEQVAAFRSAEPGTVYRFSINPEGWNAKLIRRSD